MEKLIRLLIEVCEKYNRMEAFNLSIENSYNLGLISGVQMSLNRLGYTTSLTRSE